MNHRSPLDPSERSRLRSACPTDGKGQPIPWTIAHRFVEDERWSGAVELTALTLDDVVLDGLRWSGGVLQRCVLRGVSFRRAALSGVRFEDVLFERCTFEGVQLDGCEFVECRFVGGSATGWRIKGSSWTSCTFEGVRGESWTIIESRLHGCSLRACTVLLLRLSRCALEGCELLGGALDGVDVGVCHVGALRLEATAVTGWRCLGGEIRTLTLAGLGGMDISFSAAEIGALSLERCSELSALRVLGGRLRELRIERCSRIEGLLLAGCALGDVLVWDSILYHTSFDGVTSSGVMRFEGTELMGLFFKDGTWANVHLRGALLGDYAAVEGTRFTSFDPAGVREAAGVRYRIENVGYGEGSMTWGASRGA